MARTTRAAKEPRARRGRTEVEAAEQPAEGGMTFHDGIVLTTFLLLAGALALVVMKLGIYPSQ